MKMKFCEKRLYSCHHGNCKMKKAQVGIVCVLFFLSAFAIKSIIPTFSNEYSFVVYDRQGHLLNAQVSADEQWRFPPMDTRETLYSKCAIIYEDSSFYFHNGIDMLAIIRALFLNIKHSRIVSGASTLTMQLARISEQNKARTFLQKVKEMALSVVLEFFYPKDVILKMYEDNAPYGGNVIGISAASWRYFSRAQDNLTVAELATLAVLPNEPSLVRPGKNDERLKAKRDSLLLRLKNKHIISEELYSLSLLEDTPTVPKPLPYIIPHYAQYIKKQSDVQFALVDIDTRLQERLNHIVEANSLEASRSGVHNACAIILENKTGRVLAYVGNTGIHEKMRIVENEEVDMVQAERSSGSLLKPFLYAASIDSSIILPTQLLRDMPTQFGSYIPQNNSHYYLGAVAANEALTKSLNIPFVYLLNQYSIEHFLALLKDLKLSTFTHDAQYYGLPLILGGGELTLFEIANAYRNLVLQALGIHTDFPISEAACRITLEVLLNGVRPNEEEAWRYFSKSKQIAWKTGTSYGNKDAWSIGVTSEYTVGVWFGNANGVGRPEITSSHLAAPLMFRIFELLPHSVWPHINEIEYKTVSVCEHSGYIAGEYCDDTIETILPSHTLIENTCPYCKPIPLTSDGKFRIGNIHETKGMPIIKNFFVLPPGQEYYYSQAHPEYEKLPPTTMSAHTSVDFEIIFPEKNSYIYIPTQVDGRPGAFVAKAAYLEVDQQLFWFLDETFIATTKNIHELELHTSYGPHHLTIMDRWGNEQTLYFFVLSE